MRTPSVLPDRVPWHVALPLWVVALWCRYFITGASLSGRKTDNATWLHAASHDFRGRPYEKLTGPIWQRVARRWAALGVPLLAVPLSALGWLFKLIWMADPAKAGTELPWVARAHWFSWALRYEIVVLVGLLIWAGYNAQRFLASRRDADDFVRPTWQAACSVMGVQYHHRDAIRMVTLPDDYRPPNVARSTALVATFRGRPLDREQQLPGKEIAVPPVRIRLYPGKLSTDAERKKFTTAVGGPLGMPDPAATWYPTGRAPYVELRPVLLPPERVSFAQVRKHFEESAMAQPILGLAAGGRPVHIDLDNDSPHILISGGSGSGKSVMLKALIAQRMHHGAGVVMVDMKMVSHRWLRSLRQHGCLYVSDPAHIHEVLVKAGEELQRRIQTVFVDDTDPKSPIRDFPVFDIVVEEINSTSIALGEYWRTVGGTGPSPAVAALRHLTFMGRELHMHLWVAGQQVTAQSLGGGAVRESFQTRLLAVWTMNTWRMLAGGMPYQRPVSGRRGAWAMLQGDEAVQVQVPYLTDDEAIGWARSGVQCPPTDIISVSAPVSGPEPDRLVTLSEALPLLSGHRTMSGLRTAITKAGAPLPIEPGGPGRPGKYSLSALQEWAGPFVQPEGLISGVVYQLRCLDGAGGVIVGYVGQTRRGISIREAEHRGDKPWADLIVGGIEQLWAAECTEEQLDAAEQHYLRELRPPYNREFQLAAPWSVPIGIQVRQRHERDRAAGREYWRPVDVYRHGAPPEPGSHGAWLVQQVEQSITERGRVSA